MEPGLEEQLQALRDELAAAKEELTAREAPFRNRVVAKEYAIETLRIEADELAFQIQKLEAEVEGPSHSLTRQAPRIARLCLSSLALIAAMQVAHLTFGEQVLVPAICLVVVLVPAFLKKK